MKLCMNRRGHSLKRPSTTMRDSDGEILGHREDWILAFLEDSLIKSIVKQSTVECHIQLHGLQSTLLWMVNRYCGIENSEWLDGTLISGYGECSCVHVGSKCIITSSSCVIEWVFCIQEAIVSPLPCFMVPNTFICRTAFATYLISILLFIYVIRWGAFYLLFTGLLMLLAVASYGLIILNDPPLQIHFHDGVLKPQFKAPFYLVLLTGVGATILAIVIVIADKIWPRKVAQVFNHSIIEDDIIFQVTITSW